MELMVNVGEEIARTFIIVMNKFNVDPQEFDEF
jgi:hypothetical protein